MEKTGCSLSKSTLNFLWSVNSYYVSFIVEFGVAIFISVLFGGEKLLTGNNWRKCCCVNVTV